MINECKINESKIRQWDPKKTKGKPKCKQLFVIMKCEEVKKRAKIEKLKGIKYPKKAVSERMGEEGRD